MRHGEQIDLLSLLLNRLRGLLLLHHQPEFTVLSWNQCKLLILRSVVGQCNRGRPDQLAITTPGTKTGIDLGTTALPHSVSKHDPGIAAAALTTATALPVGPEVREVQHLWVGAAKGLGHLLSLLPALGLRVPLALPNGRIVRQEGIGGAVGVVDQLDATGISHANLKR